MKTSVILPPMSWASPYPGPKTQPKPAKSRGSSRSLSGSSRSSRSCRSSRSGKIQPTLLNCWMQWIDFSDKSNEKLRLNNEVRERPRIGERHDRRRERSSPRPRIEYRDDRPYEPRPSIEDREDHPDERAFRRKKDDRDDSSGGGSNSGPPRTDDRRDHRPRERRRSTKAQDPGFANFID